MKNIICTGLLAAGLLFTACDKQHGEANKEPADINKNTMEEAKQINKDNEAVEEKCSDFITDAASHNKMEMELSKMASERAYSKEVKVYAQQLVGDHSKAETELREIADKRSLELATEIEPEHTDASNKLSAEKGISFDKAYLDLMVRYHRKGVKMFEDASEDCEDGGIKSFASSNLPVLEKHLETAELMQEAIRKKSKEGYTGEKPKEGPH